MVSGVTSDPLGHWATGDSDWHYGIWVVGPGHIPSAAICCAKPHCKSRKYHIDLISFPAISASPFVLERSPFRPHYSAYRCELRPLGAMNTNIVPSLSGGAMDLAD